MDFDFDFDDDDFLFIDEHLFLTERQEQRLEFWLDEFTSVKAQFLVDFLRRHPLVAGSVEFRNCSFHSNDGCLDILKVYFAEMIGLRVRLILYNDNILIKPDWLPSAIAFTTNLDLSCCSSLGDDANFKHVVDIILGGNAKKNLRVLRAENAGLSSNDLVDLERLVEHSQLEHLYLDSNRGILDNQERMQSLCDKLKKNKSLCTVSFRYCGASEATANATTTMFVDKVFPVNTTLTLVALGQSTSYPYRENDIINRHQLDACTILNERLAEVFTGVQGLLLANNNNINHQQNNEMDPENHFTIAHEKIWRHIVNAAMEDVDRDKSALFQLMRHAIVGHEACPLHDKVVEALKESARAHEQQESPSEEALQAKIIESLQADNVSLQAENDSLHAKVESLQVANESLQQRLAASRNASSWGRSWWRMNRFNSAWWPCKNNNNNSDR